MVGQIRGGAVRSAAPAVEVERPEATRLGECSFVLKRSALKIRALIEAYGWDWFQSEVNRLTSSKWSNEHRQWVEQLREIAPVVGIDLSPSTGISDFEAEPLDSPIQTRQDYLIPF